MFRRTRSRSIRTSLFAASLAVALSVLNAPPTKAQGDPPPCFTMCHNIAMQMWLATGNWKDANEFFQECIDDNC